MRVNSPPGTGGGRKPSPDVPAEGAGPPSLPEPTPEDEALETPAEPAALAPEPAEDFKDRWLRAEAELANFRRRAQRDLEETRRSTEDRGLLEIVMLLDDLERALKAAADAGAPESWRAGVLLVAQRMRDVLARSGVAPIEALGLPFDPFLHEALLEVDPPEGVPGGQVIEVARTGWQRGGRPLRAARVVVARQVAGGE